MISIRTDGLLEDFQELQTRFSAIVEMSNDLESFDCAVWDSFSSRCNAFEEVYSSNYLEFNSSLRNAIWSGVRGGRMVEDLVYGNDLGLKQDSMKFTFKLEMCDGKDVVVGGEILTTDATGAVRIRIDDETAESEPNVGWQMLKCHQRYGLDVGGEEYVHSAMVEFFSREYKRLHDKK